MKSFVNTVVGGMIGLAALYVVGRIAYQAGHDMAEMECRYDEIKRQTQALEAPKDRRDECEKKESVVQREEPDVIVATVPKKQPRSLMTGVMQMIGGKKESVCGCCFHGFSNLPDFIGPGFSAPGFCQFKYRLTGQCRTILPDLSHQILLCINLNSPVFHDLFERLLEGDGADLAAEEMHRLLVIAREEPEFWEKGAPFEEFIALLREEG